MKTNGAFHSRKSCWLRAALIGRSRVFEIAEKLSGETHHLSMDFVRIYDRNKQLETTVKKKRNRNESRPFSKDPRCRVGFFTPNCEGKAELLSALAECRKKGPTGHGDVPKGASRVELGLSSCNLTTRMPRVVPISRPWWLRW